MQGIGFAIVAVPVRASWAIVAWARRWRCARRTGGLHFMVGTVRRGDEGLPMSVARFDRLECRVCGHRDL